MNKGFKILSGIILGLIAFGVASVFNYFQFVYFNTNYKKELCERLNEDVESIVVSYRVIADYNVDKELVIEGGDELESLEKKIREVCQGSYNEGLFARYSTTVIKCKVLFRNSDEIYLRLIGFESGKAYIEFHRGGWFSLIGAIEDNNELTNTLISIY